MDANIKIENTLANVFEENGIFIDDKTIMLADYFPDSLTFVNIIIGIEEAFDIELPDEMLLIENLGTFNNLVERIMIEMVLKRASNDDCTYT